MAIDSWGETVFHSMAKRKRLRLIQIILNSLNELGESIFV